jgi:nucleotide-binding universal stress UspA family protein
VSRCATCLRSKSPIAWPNVSSEALFQRVANRAKGEFRWVGLSGPLVERICERARYADLVIVGQEPTEASAERNPLSLAEGIVHSSGRPILVTPDNAQGLRVPKQILIAWDGSREAVRAVHDAIPLLRSADVVEIVVANSEREHIPEDVAKGTELIDHLAYHGIKIDESNVVRLHQKEPSAILDHLRSSAFDLLVMGAYSHPAWREFLFGGTTFAAVRNASAPILLSR